jgi:hypothetical protein
MSRANGCLIALALSPLLVLGIGGLTVYCYFSQHISTVTVISQTPSPDGAWKAVVDDDLEETPVQSYDEGRVWLVSARDPGVRVELVAYDVAAHYDDMPRITWAGPHVLNVGFRRAYFVDVQTRQHDDIMVNFLFDDPTRVPPDVCCNQSQ